jgi:DNA-binding PadR family transcriptional regulator
LRRLETEGLVSVDVDGKYSITKKGKEITADLESFNGVVQKQIDVMLRVGNVGKFMAMDVIDRIATIGSALSSNLETMTVQEKEKYRQFLLSELNKLDHDSGPTRVKIE